MPCVISDPPENFGEHLCKTAAASSVPLLCKSPPPLAAGEPKLPRPGSPAAEGGLQQGGDAHAEEDGPDELAGGPLVEAHAHGIGQQEGHGDGPAETRQVVLGAQGGLVLPATPPSPHHQLAPSWAISSSSCCC